MPRNPGDRKERIIAAAMKLWRQAHDVNKVSLADISREAGVAPATVYNHFGTREGLVHQVIRRVIGDILERQKAVLESDLPFAGKLQAVIGAKLRPIEGMEIDLLDKISTDPTTRQYVEDITEADLNPIMKAIIQEGKREGYIRPDLPDEAIMLYFEVLKSGAMARTEDMKRIVADREMMHAFAQLVYFGIFQKEFDVTLNNTGANKES